MSWTIYGVRYLPKAPKAKATLAKRLNKRRVPREWKCPGTDAIAK